MDKRECKCNRFNDYIEGNPPCPNEAKDNHDLCDWCLANGCPAAITRRDTMLRVITVEIDSNAEIIEDMFIRIKSMLGSKLATTDFYVHQPKLPSE